MVQIQPQFNWVEFGTGLGLFSLNPLTFAVSESSTRKVIWSFFIPLFFPGVLPLIFSANQWFQICNIFFRFRYSPRFDCTFLFLGACRAFSPAPSFFLLTLTCLPVYSIVSVYPGSNSSVANPRPSFEHTPRVEHHDDDCRYLFTCTAFHSKVLMQSRSVASFLGLSSCSLPPQKRALRILR